MKRIFLGTTLIIALLQSVLWAAEEKAGELDQKGKISYSIGMNFGKNLKRYGYTDVDVDVLAGAIKDVLSGKEPKLTDAQVNEVISSYQKEMAAKREQERQVLSQKNRKEGEAFLEENKKKEGVKTHTVTYTEFLPNGQTEVKTDDLQYKVIKEGTGPKPTTNDIVKVNYRGTLVNGTEFDASPKDTPTQFPVTRVIKGWAEALLMMKTGSKWQLFIPSSLAYGERGHAPKIEPGATLIFEVELVSAETPPPPAPAQPLTSDIIKVPSADELKKGAKIEVIKPEEVDKKIKEAQQSEQKK